MKSKSFTPHPYKCTDQPHPIPKVYACVIPFITFLSVVSSCPATSRLLFFVSAASFKYIQALSLPPARSSAPQKRVLTWSVTFTSITHTMINELMIMILTS